VAVILLLVFHLLCCLCCRVCSICSRRRSPKGWPATAQGAWFRFVTRRTCFLVCFWILFFAARPRELALVRAHKHPPPPFPAVVPHSANHSANLGFPLPCPATSVCRAAPAPWRWNAAASGRWGYAAASRGWPKGSRCSRNASSPRSRCSKAAWAARRRRDAASAKQRQRVLEAPGPAQCR
jgi:hypothetical protein